MDPTDARRTAVSLPPTGYRLDVPSFDHADLEPRTPRTRRFTARERVAWTVWARQGQHRVRFHTVDVSARGAKLRPRGVFPVGSPLQLEFIKPDEIGRAHV